MRELHLAEGETHDGRLVLVTSDGFEHFELPVDADVQAAVTAAAYPAPTGEPTITAREIQMRVRAGEQPAELAQASNAALNWVMRFAAPVLDERNRVAGEARRARARRSTTDGQLVVFGEAVDERFAAYGIEPADVRWDAQRREDGNWLIRATWLSGQREFARRSGFGGQSVVGAEGESGGQSEHSADWTFQLAARTVTPCDDAAADLLSDRPIRPLVPPEPAPQRNLSLAPPLAPGVVAFPVMPGAPTGPLPTVLPPDEVFDQDRDAPPPASAQAAQSRIEDRAAQHFEQNDAPAAEPGGMPIIEQTVEQLIDQPVALPDDPEPVLPLAGMPEVDRTAKIPRLGSVARAKESEEQRAARASVPSWDDILLGVRRRHD